MSDGTDVIHRIHHSEVPELQAIWEALEATELPKVGSCSKLFAHLPGVPKQIKALGETCFTRPPVKVPFDRRWAFRYDENWVVHLGRLTYDHEKALDTPLARTISSIFGDQGRLSGFFYYPPGGFKEWHTDFEDPQPDSEKHWRIYMLRTTRDARSWFQYLDADGKIRKVVDRNGHLNVFSLTESPPLWHAVYSNTHRWSVGIKLDPAIIESLIADRKAA
jgi:hypothetical protein